MLGFQCKNTLAVVSDGAHVSVENGAFALEVEDSKTVVPVNIVGDIMFFGNHVVSTSALRLAAANGVSVAFLSRYGRSALRLDGGEVGNVLLRRAQWERYFDAEARLELARQFVVAKVDNQRRLVKTFMRNHPSDALAEACDELAVQVNDAESASDLNELMLHEAHASACYWNAFGCMLRSKTFKFDGRSKRPPRDEVNAVLSFLYVILCNDCAGALHAVGFDEQCGYLHSLRSGRASLACDLMEELRAPVVDRFTLTTFNRNQFASIDFERKGQGVYLSEVGVKKAYGLLSDWRKQTVHHNGLNEDVTVGELCYAQASILARYVRGENDAYYPFKMPL